MSDAAEMQDLLAYASYAKVGKALGVSRNAVSLWARGKDVTPYRLNQVRQLLRPEEIAAPPAWAERLLAGVVALETKAGVSDAERDRAAALAAGWLATAGLSGSPRQGGGGAGGASNA